MELHFNVNGEARKKLVAAISLELGIPAEYLRVPTYAYQIGAYNVSREGTLTFPDETDTAESSRVIDACVMSGFEPEEWDQNVESENDEPDGEETARIIEMPIDRVSADNLKKLIEAKGSLIRTAFGIEDIGFEVTDDRVIFPWLKEIPSAEETEAYTKFIAALCEMSVNAKRVTAKDKEVDNPKYAFRCFLLRLGFIGDEYKNDRKILLRNFTGSSAFRNGSKKGGEEA